MATEQNIFGDYTLTVPAPTSLFFLLSGKHDYANVSGVKPWQMAIYFDGALLNYAGGAGAYTDAPTLFASALNVAAGTHTIRATWYGDTSMKLRGANMLVESTFK